MTMIITGQSTSLDGFIAGADDGMEQPLGIDGDRLFRWFSDGDTPSRYYPSFRMSAASAAVFDEAAGRIGAVIGGRRTYDIAPAWGGSGPFSPRIRMPRPPAGAPHAKRGPALLPTEPAARPSPRD